MKLSGKVATITGASRLERATTVVDNPIGRIGTPDDVTKAILYFVSHDSS